MSGAIYRSAVEGSLSRILHAVAPQGSSAQENRLQCLKVNTDVLLLFLTIITIILFSLQGIISISVHFSNVKISVCNDRITLEHAVCLYRAVIIIEWTFPYILISSDSAGILENKISAALLKWVFQSQLLVSFLKQVFETVNCCVLMNEVAQSHGSKHKVNY